MSKTGRLLKSFVKIASARRCDSQCVRQTLRGENKSEAAEYGIENFVYRARRPFHPAKFWEFISRTRPALLRVKGFFWLASHPRITGLYQQAGGACRVSPVGVWWADTPREDWETDAEALAEIALVWDEDAGDRRQEIVFIGQHFDRETLVAELDDCLITEIEAELTERDWSRIKHPFIKWTHETESLLAASSFAAACATL